MELVSTILVLPTYYFFFLYLSRKFNLDINILNYFFLIKIIYLLIFLYLNISGTYSMDTKSLFADYKNFNPNNFPIGNQIIYGLNYFFLYFFNLSFYNINLIFIFPNIFCTILLLDLIRKIKNKQIIFLLYILLSLPSFNLWTVGLNKDMLSFLMFSIFLYGVYKEKFILIIISIVFSFLIRPYLTWIILAALLIYIIFVGSKKILNGNYNINSIKNFFYGLIIFISIISIFFFTKSFIGPFGRMLVSGELIEIIHNLQNHYADTKLGIPEGNNLFIRTINYIFFPLFNMFIGKLEPNFILYLIFIENIFLLLSLVVILRNFKFKTFKENNLFFYISIINFLLLLIILSTVTSNYGIAMRQKWMIIPYLYILLSLNTKKSFSFNINFLKNKK